MAESEPAANGRLKVPQPVIYIFVALIGWMLSAYSGYAAASASMNARVSVLESQYQALHSDIADIKADIKILLRRP